MPRAFENCLKNGGRVRTVSLKDGKYVHVCYKGDKQFRGHVKTKKK